MKRQTPQRSNDEMMYQRATQRLMDARAALLAANEILSDAGGGYRLSIEQFLFIALHAIQSAQDEASLDAAVMGYRELKVL